MRDGGKIDGDGRGQETLVFHRDLIFEGGGEQFLLIDDILLVLINISIA